VRGTVSAKRGLWLYHFPSLGPIAKPDHHRINVAERRPNYLAASLRILHRGDDEQLVSRTRVNNRQLLVWRRFASGRENVPVRARCGNELPVVSTSPDFAAFAVGFLHPDNDSRSVR